ncbi:MAG: hypothetical protein ACXU82_04290 [Caulobacteraceae bacterium]
MWTHRLAGGLLAAFGLVLLALQLALLYGSIAEQGLMVAIGLPGTAVLSALGAVCFAAGCLLAAAPAATVRHARRAASAVRRPTWR